MKAKCIIQTVILSIGISLFTVACDDGGGDGDATVDVTGTWTGAIVKTTTQENGTATLVLIQDGTNVTGTEQDTWTTRAAVQGTVSGRNVDLTIMDDVGTRLSGEVSGNTMVCTWTSGDGTTGTGTLLRE